MKILVMGDIHGNLPAFEQMLAREKNNFDLLVCHGDVVNYGPWSNECVDLLETLSHTIKLKGNHEDDFLKGAYSGTHPVATAFFDFHYALFNRHRVIEAYGDSTVQGSFTIQHTIEGRRLFEDTDVIIDRNYIVGHSHYQFVRSIAGWTLANTGSVGQNRAFINEVNYLFLNLADETLETKKWLYDPHVLIRELEARHYPRLCIDYYRHKPWATP